MRAGLSWMAVAVLAGCSGGSPAADVEDADDGLEALPDAEDAGIEDAAPPEDRSGDVRPDGDPFPPVCGDGYLDPAEECDDGNRFNGDECDWECRVGPGSFEYPEPDPAVPQVEPEGPAVEVVGISEGMNVNDSQSLRMIWAGHSFVLVYKGDLPYPAVRVRLLDGTGAAAGGPWEYPVAWSSPLVAAARASDEVGVFIGESATGRLFLWRIDPDTGPIADPIELLPPPPAVQWSALESVAWSLDRYVVASQSWQFTAVSKEGVLLGPHRSLGGFIDSANFLAQVLATPEGIAATNMLRLVALDRELRVLGWSGVLPGEPSTWPVRIFTGLEPVSPVADGLLLFWTADRLAEVSGNVLDLYVGKTDFAGDLVLPPRRVLPDVTAYTHHLTTTTGSAGTAVVWCRGTEDGLTPGNVYLATTDRFGNVRTGPVEVLEEADRVRRCSSVAVAADETGFAVVAIGAGDGGSGYVLLFRRYAPAS